MATFKKFEDIDVWKKSREFAIQIYKLSEQGSFSKDFELRNHIRKTAGSVMDNIAEGFEREGNREFIQFLYISKGSAGELKSQLIRAKDFGYINEEELKIMYNQIDEISKMLKGLIEYLRKSDLKGNKYK